MAKDKATPPLSAEQLQAMVEAIELRLQKLERPWHNSTERHKKWRRSHAAERQALSKQYKDSFNAGATRNRHDWTMQEIELLDDEKFTDSELCSKLQRTMRAIQTKRYKLRVEGGTQ